MFIKCFMTSDLILLHHGYHRHIETVSISYKTNHYINSIVRRIDIRESAIKLASFGYDRIFSGSSPLRHPPFIFVVISGIWGKALAMRQLLSHFYCQICYSNKKRSSMPSSRVTQQLVSFNFERAITVLIRSSIGLEQWVLDLNSLVDVVELYEATIIPTLISDHDILLHIHSWTGKCRNCVWNLKEVTAVFLFNPRTLSLHLTNANTIYWLQSEWSNVVAIKW